MTEYKKTELDPRLAELINQFSSMESVDIEWILENSPGVTEEAVQRMAQEVFSKGVDSAQHTLESMTTKGDLDDKGVMPHHMKRFDFNNDGEINGFPI